MSKLVLRKLGQEEWGPEVSALDSRIDVLEAVSGLDINKKKATPAPPDDDFDVGSALDTAGTRHSGATPWVAVSGTAGAVGDITQDQTATAVYEFRAVEDVLLLRHGSSNSVHLRLDYTLPDGASIVAALSLGIHADALFANNESRILLVVNNVDGGYGSADSLWIGLDTNTDEISVKSFGDSGGSPTKVVDFRPGIAYLRIARVGLVYHPFISFDGLSWTPGTPETFAAAGNNIWVVFASEAAYTGRCIIGTLLWIRQGTNAAFPWDIVT